MNLSQDIRSVTDLKRHTKEMVQQVNSTKRPIIVTVNGRADVVLIDVESYEKQLKALKLMSMLAKGEADIKAGRVQSLDDVMKELLEDEENKKI